MACGGGRQVELKSCVLPKSYDFGYKRGGTNARLAGGPRLNGRGYQSFSTAELCAPRHFESCVFRNSTLLRVEASCSIMLSTALQAWMTVP